MVLTKSSSILLLLSRVRLQGSILPWSVLGLCTHQVIEIYGRNANVQKSTAYRAFETSSTAHDTQSTVNKVAHARKRRVISQAFSDSAIRSFEDHVLGHVKSFVMRLSTAEATSESLKDNPWSSDLNMASWCKYLSQSIHLSSVASWQDLAPAEQRCYQGSSSLSVSESITNVPSSTKKSVDFLIGHVQSRTASVLMLQACL